MKTSKIQQLLLSVTCAASLSLVSAAAAATEISWTGSSDFESEQISFTAFRANQLTGISSLAFGPGGYAHTHFGDMTFSIKLNVDGVWTQVYSQTLDNNNTYQYLSQISGPMNFAEGMVSGLWLDSSPQQFNSYHDFSGCLDQQCTQFGNQVAFSFADVAAVPEPASLALVGLGLLGVAARRRRKQ